MMYARNTFLKRFFLILGILTSLTQTANLYAVDWHDQCAEETETFCADSQDLSERNICLAEHRDMLSGFCLERVLEFIQKHPELDETIQQQDMNSYWIYTPPKPTVPVAPPKKPVLEPNCNGINAFNTECYSR